MAHDKKVVFLRPRDRFNAAHETDPVAKVSDMGLQGRRTDRSGFGGASLELLRYLLVVLLMFLRRPIKIALGFFAFGLTATGGLLYFGYPEGAPQREAMLPWAPLGGFAAFAASYAYDSILMRLSREQLFLH